MSRKFEFMDNLININRYPSDTLIKSESVSDHVWCMVGLALEYVPKLNQTHESVKFNLEHIITLITLHDIDESLYCDIPRKFKHDNVELTSAIEKTSNKLLKSRVSPEIYDLISSSTDKSTVDGVLVKIFDIAQAGYKMLSEIKLGNSNFLLEIDEIFDCLEGMKSYLHDMDLDVNITNALVNLCDEFQEDINRQLNKIKSIK